MISYSRAWVDQAHNFDPASNCDDWTDITLLRYAGDGDIILTADKKLQTAIGMVEPSGTVQVKTTEELYHRGFIFVPKTPRNKRF
ncbi:MAG: hypothetical protein DMG74_01700 [Acidobacteria bacterium]|nr:MAG: hypothetical protein DMG74_01700 [Acidobacteriota bacterium]